MHNVKAWAQSLTTLCRPVQAVTYKCLYGQDPSEEWGFARNIWWVWRQMGHGWFPPVCVRSWALYGTQRLNRWHEPARLMWREGCNFSQVTYLILSALSSSGMSGVTLVSTFKQRFEFGSCSESRHSECCLTTENGKIQPKLIDGDYHTTITDWETRGDPYWSESELEDYGNEWSNRDSKLTETFILEGLAHAIQHKPVLSKYINFRFFLHFFF